MVAGEWWNFLFNYLLPVAFSHRVLTHPCKFFLGTRDTLFFPLPLHSGLLVAMSFFLSRAGEGVRPFAIFRLFSFGIFGIEGSVSLSFLDPYHHHPFVLRSLSLYTPWSCSIV
jgi:hypothetical protein